MRIQAFCEQELEGIRHSGLRRLDTVDEKSCAKFHVLFPRK